MRRRECLDAAEVLARVLAAAIAGRGTDSLDDAEEAELSAPKVRSVAEGSWRGKPRENIRSSGYVVDTLEAALWAVAASGSFEEAVLKAVNLGDDADTVGAVAGQIAGAIWGYSSIPERWRNRLAWHDRLVSVRTPYGQLVNMIRASQIPALPWRSAGWMRRDSIWRAELR